MIKKRFSLALFILCLSLQANIASAEAPEEEKTFNEYLDKANNYIKAYRHFEASDVLRDAVRLGGEKHPVLHMRLGVLYYGLGMIPEAIAEGEKAVELVPTAKWYRYDLAKFYFVDKQFDKAEQQILALLELDPGFTHGYRFLSELYFHKKEYDMAWLSLQRARLLGFDGKQLEEKLAPLTSKPVEDFAETPLDNGLFRYITLAAEQEAKDTLDEIWKGKLFEDLEFELKQDETSKVQFGLIRQSELQNEVADALQNSQPYSPPVIVKTGSEFRIMQRIVAFDRKSLQRTHSVVSGSIPGNPTNPTTAPATPDTEGPEQQESYKLVAEYAVENWKTAWAAQKADEYLLAYSSSFKPSGNMSLDTWKKKRHKSLTAPKFIHIDIQDLDVKMQAENQLQLTFKQNYASDNYQDSVIKTLIMVKEAEGWKIITEEEVEKIAP